MKNKDVIPIEKAGTILVGELQNIHTVSEWAEKMGYPSAPTFFRDFKRYAGLPPEKVLIQVRLVCIMKLISYAPQLTGYEIALESGLADEKALYDFLARYKNTTLSELKRQLLKKK